MVDSPSPLFLRSKRVLIISGVFGLVDFIRLFIIGLLHFVGCWGRRLVSGTCVSWFRSACNGLGYQPGALAVLGSNPSDPTTIIQVP